MDFVEQVYCMKVYCMKDYCMKDKDMEVLSERYIRDQEEVIREKFDNICIHVENFLIIAKNRVLNSIGLLGPGACRIKSLAWVRNVRFLMSLEIEHASDSLFAEYKLLNDFCEEQSLQYDQHEHSLIQEKKHNKYDMDEVVKVNDIDRIKPNGMTPMCDIIMMYDDVDKVKNLVEEFGACPMVKSGQYFPLDLARHLGRVEVAGYLESLITELSEDAA